MEDKVRSGALTPSAAAAELQRLAGFGGKPNHD
jgi:hypothetical protein